MPDQNNQLQKPTSYPFQQTHQTTELGWALNTLDGHELPPVLIPKQPSAFFKGKEKRSWPLALKCGVVWPMEPSLGEIADMIKLIACASNKAATKSAIAQLRANAESLRKQMAPLCASALIKVVRRAEAACGAVLDKGARIKEVETSWNLFMACVSVKPVLKPVPPLG